MHSYSVYVFCVKYPTPWYLYMVGTKMQCICKTVNCNTYPLSQTYSQIIHVRPCLVLQLVNVSKLLS